MRKIAGQYWFTKRMRWISSFRTYILSISLLMAVAYLVANAHATISNVSSRTVEARVILLERISNAQAQLIQQLQQQLSTNQNDIDQLRGQIQENSYQLNQVLEHQKDFDQQISRLISGGTSLGTVAPTQRIDDNTDYHAAVSLVLEKKQYDQAIVAFQIFVKNYPDSTYQPNANYWLGQLCYNKGSMDDAAYYFATVVKNYPKSSKSADALLKVGVIMQKKGDKTKAQSVYQKVAKLYPNSDAAKQALKLLASF